MEPENTMHTFIIFEIDNPTAARLMAVEDLFEGSNTKPVSCTGGWEGDTSPSFIARMDDFDRLIRPSGYVDNQDCFMTVSECNKMYCGLAWADGHYEPMGNMTQVTEEQALAAPGYTYRHDLDIYWMAAHGNPDHVNGENSNPPSQSIHVMDKQHAIAAE